MKVGEQWLREFINPAVSVQALADQLSNAGIEVDSLDILDDAADQAKTQGILTLKVPPNRGDCLSMEGVAREVSLLNNISFQPVTVAAVMPTVSDTLPVQIENTELCPRYLGCIVKNIRSTVATPAWMKERLETAGIRSVSVIVDIMNYVMLELGQPLHAFDLTTLDSEIVVRTAKPGENIQLLDGQEIKLQSDTLVIADKTKAQAIAGIMGGMSSSVTDATTAIFIESAYFNPVAVRLAAKQYGLKTDGSHRFERGVDPTLQRRALERAVQLVLEIVGGIVGSIVERKNDELIPKIPLIFLRKERIVRLLGMSFTDSEILNIFSREGFQISAEKDGFRVQAASYRHDINLEIDLIEEIARIHGLSNFPSASLSGAIKSSFVSETEVSSQRFKNLLVDRGYCEAITYAFVDPKLTAVFELNAKPLALSNPLSAEMAVMRTSLLPGLVQALQYNQHRQLTRARLFETGVCFIEQDGKIIETQMLSGICVGTVYPEQWGVAAKPVDFYDIKGDVEALLALMRESVGENGLSFEHSEHSALHPGQSAKILKQGQAMGWVGALHPKILKTLDLEGPIMTFEVALEALTQAKTPVVSVLSKFPAIRRDLALLVDKGVFAADLKSAIVRCAGEFLQSVLLFDVYQGVGVPGDKKSIALGLILQHPSRTLVEGEVNDILQKVVTMLAQQFQAILRE